MLSGACKVTCFPSAQTPHNSETAETVEKVSHIALFGTGCSTSQRVAHVLSTIMETDADGGSIDKMDVSGCQKL